MAAGALALASLTGGAVALEAAPAQAQPLHWGTGAAQLSMSNFSGIPTVLSPPSSSSWSLRTTTAKAAIYHQGTEATAGDVRINGTLSAAKENTLGAEGTMSLTVSALPSGTATSFTASGAGQWRRTQTWLQFEVNGTAQDANGNAAAVRIVADGLWRPVTGDGVTTRITGAEAVMSVSIIFPGTVPPPPGPKGASSLVLAADAYLPAFPCPAPLPGQFPCAGTLTGSLDGSLSGDDAAGLWSIVLTAPVSTSFGYVDSFDPGASCVAQSAFGSTSISLNRDGVIGVWANHAHTPVEVIGAELSFEYSWVRAGTVMAWSLTRVGLMLHTKGPKGWVEVLSPASTTASAVTAFVPDLTTAHIDACLANVPGPALNADVAGIASLNGVF